MFNVQFLEIMPVKFNVLCFPFLSLLFLFNFSWFSHLYRNWVDWLWSLFELFVQRWHLFFNLLKGLYWLLFGLKFDPFDWIMKIALFFDFLDVLLACGLGFSWRRGLLASWLSLFLDIGPLFFNHSVDLRCSFLGVLSFELGSLPFRKLQVVLVRGKIHLRDIH